MSTLVSLADLIACYCQLGFGHDGKDPGTFCEVMGDVMFFHSGTAGFFDVGHVLEDIVRTEELYGLVGRYSERMRDLLRD